MSLKRQIQFKYKNFITSLRAISLPKWVTSKSTRVILSLTIISFGIAYVLNTTSSATSGYEMNKLEKQVEALEIEVQKLQVEVASNSSIGNIQTRLTKLNMVEATGIKYFTLKNTAVAKN